ncbi:MULTISPECIES: SPFH domain-containing protein [unclassified Streptomyces]|uniref:SPFH domain-containing protein n=1 Tax=unclassified Streptomyces TaxID=2593676 RepID=UPI001010577D|nr:hypothetical protein [Streptomyces sp. GZWMJZ-114]
MSLSHEPETSPHDPVLLSRALSRFEFVRNRPPTHAERALVLLAPNGKAHTYLPGQQPTRGELVSGNFRTLYEVDLGVRHLSLRHELPSRGDAAFFVAEVDLTWRVTDAAVIVNRRIRDVRALVEPRLRSLMRRATRRFDIEDSAKAEDAVAEALADTELAADEGLTLSYEVRLSLDSEAMRQFSALRGLRHEIERTRGQHALDSLRTENDQETMESKAVFFSGMLARDEFEGWGAHLAQNPQDLPLAIESVRNDRREASANKIRFIERLLDSGLIEEHMVGETGRVAVESLHEMLADAGAGRTRKQPLYREQLDSAAKDEEQSGPPEDAR